MIPPGTVRAWRNLLPASLRAGLQNGSDMRPVLSNMGWLFCDKVLRMGVGLLVSIWIARYLGPGQFGLLSYAMAFAAIFCSIATLGLDGIIVREIVKSQVRKEEILGTSLWMRICSGCLSLVVVITAIALVREGDQLTRLLVAIIAAGSVFQAFDVIDLWFQAQIKSKYSVFAKSTAFLTISIAKMVAIFQAAPLLVFALLGLLEVILGAIMLVAVYQGTGGRIRMWNTNLATAKQLLKDSWPLIFSGVVIMIYMRIDQIMIGEMVGSNEVGVYAVAVKLAEVWYFIPMVIVASVFPKIIRAKEVSEELFYDRLQKLYNLMAFLGYAIAVPMTFLSGWIVDTLYKAEYSGAGPMLALLIWAGLFANLGLARSSFLTTMNWTRIHFATVFIGCIINVALNLFLIPLYGGMGAVVASLISYWFAAHGACFLWKPLRPTAWMMLKAVVWPKIY